MSYYGNKGKSNLYLMRILVAFFLICISIITIYIVISKVGDIRIAEGITVKGDDVKFFIKTDESDADMFFVSDEKGLRCKKQDNSFAREEWIEKNGELFYFDTSSYGKNGDLRLDGQVYTLENGKLKKIVKDKSYASSINKNYFSSVEATTFLAYLDKEQNEDGYYPVRYLKYGDEDDDFLGTENDKQYASPYMLKTNENTIYFLALGSKTNYSGRLYRMKPNGSIREGVGTSVQGYIVLSSDVVYYYDGARIIKAKNWIEDEVKTFEEDPTPLDFPFMSTPSDIIGTIINVLPLPVDDNSKKIDDEVDDAIEPETPSDKDLKKKKIDIEDDPKIVNVEEIPVIEPTKTDNKKIKTNDSVRINKDAPSQEDAIIVEPIGETKLPRSLTTDNDVFPVAPPVSGEPSISTNRIR